MLFYQLPCSFRYSRAYNKYSIFPRFINFIHKLPSCTYAKKPPIALNLYNIVAIVSFDVKVMPHIT